MVIRSESFSWSRLILNQVFKRPTNLPIGNISRINSTYRYFPSSQSPSNFHFPGKCRFFSADSTVQELLKEVEWDRQRERDQRKKAGLGVEDIDAEEQQDFMGVGPLIEKLEKEKLKLTADLHMDEEPTDSESDEDDERFTAEAVKKRSDDFDKKFKRHGELLKNFTEAETLDEAFKWMNRVDKFEQKHLRLRPEYRVIGELMNRLKGAEGKDKFLIQQKLNRAVRLVEWKEAYDPNNPANYGVIQHEQLGPSADLLENAGFEKEKQIIQGDDDDDEDEEFDDMKERDDILLEKLNFIDKKLEEKLADLDHTFGKKGKLLEEEIRDLAEERNTLTEKKRRPMYRKVRIIVFCLFYAIPFKIDS